MYDVIVIGGGPGGAVSAQRCARQGFKTLLVERKRLPRDKVCSGMVMGPWANEIIQQEFGKIPEAVLASPYYLSGHQIHLPGVQPQIIQCKTPLAWRKDLDFWMIQNARKAGVEIRDEAKVIGLNHKTDPCSVTMIQLKKTQEVKSRFVIGADGAASAVRKSIFPKLKVRYSAPIRECYKGNLDLDNNYFHWFFPKYRARPRFGLNHKDDYFLIEGSGIKELKHEIIHILTKYGFNAKSKALWKDGCLIPQLHEALISKRFFPAIGNVMLIGDAAGLLLPITFEGIGTALKSGRLAVDAIVEAAKYGKEAAGIYLQKLQSILAALERFHLLNAELTQMKTSGAFELSKAITAAYQDTLKVT
ncbi:MAG: NAD(P)/FAD-dependent oxidoreductase [Deltaproteobacteria bacterium]|jgi:flavin-dependent dehydrogenase|nr:NAD(P)/FAD-dependent oxidoreductase [Deltaproteobacteria bacterium]